MSELKATPGPWAIAETNTAYAIRIPARRETAEHATLTYIDKNKRSAKANAHLIAAAPELYRCLNASTCTLIAERDCFYESVVAGDTGEVPDEDSRRQLAEMDAEIDANQKALAKAHGETE